MLGIYGGVLDTEYPAISRGKTVGFQETLRAKVI